MFYNNHPAAGNGNTLLRVLWKMFWELVFHMRDSFAEDTTSESQPTILQHFSFHFLHHFMFK